MGADIFFMAVSKLYDGMDNVGEMRHITPDKRFE